MNVKKWLRQQSKDYALGFDALVERWNNVGRRMLFPDSNIACFISICDLFIDYPSLLYLF
jgi:hypothetical protein